METGESCLAMGDRSEHYLRPSTLYSLNRIIYELLDEQCINNDEVVVVPSTFRPSNRTWQLSCVMKTFWRAAASSETTGTPDVFKDCCWFITKLAVDHELDQTFADFLKTFEKVPEALQRLLVFKNAITNLPDLDQHPLKLQKPWEKSASEEESTAYEAFKNSELYPKVAAQWIDGSPRLVRDVLTLVELLPISRDLFLPGVVQRVLEKRPSLQTRLRYVLAQISPDNPSDVYPDDSNEAINQFGDSAEGRGTSLARLALALFLPPFLREIQERILLYSQHVETERSRLSQTICFPVYSTWIGANSYGFLRAQVDCTFLDGSILVTSGDGSQSLPRREAALERSFEQLSQEVAQSCLAEIAALPIKPPYDLVEHFVRCIVHLQDWESISVYREGALPYSYRRTYPSALTASLTYRGVPTWERYPTPNEPSDPSRSQSDKLTWLAWKDDDDREFHFWSHNLLPELSHEEQTAFAGVTLTFEFPRTAVLPDNPATLARFRYALIEEHIDVMRTLISKVRARREALRNAMSAIMGRNMSHNIGSHVLARYSGQITNDLAMAPPNGSDHRAEFLRYLQRRMDFIAEVATTDRSMWSQPLGLRQVLDRLHLGKQKTLINGTENPLLQNASPILLTYVSGKFHGSGPVTATVEITAPSDAPASEWYFDCPGGEVGAHALYVILENVIRNSARHSSEALLDCITMRVTVEAADSSSSTPDSDAEAYWKITIVDPRSKEPSAQISEQVPGETNAVEKIHTLLFTNRALLDSSGGLDRHNWGIREIQICATYLRGLQLSDLEGQRGHPEVLAAHWTKDNRELAYELYVRCASLALFIVKDALETILPPEFKVKYATKAEDLLRFVSVARGYAFVVIDESLISPNIFDKSAWPVRTFLKSAESISQILKATLMGMGALDWLDQFLHAETVLQYRAAHPTWLNKSDTHIMMVCDGALVRHPEENSLPPLMRIHKADISGWRDGHLQIPDTMRLAWLDHFKNDYFGMPTGVYFTDAFLNKPTDAHFHFVEGVRSASPHRDTLNSLKAGSAPYNELVAAALARVIVLDERVQAEANKGYAKSGLTYLEYWPYWGIWVPENATTDLNKPDLASICTFLHAPATATCQGPADFLVIHLTVLEGLKRQAGGTEQSVIKQMTACRGVGPDCEIVVVTGRGVPTVATRASQNGERHFRYLPVSAVLEYLVHNPSKLMLMRALWSSASGIRK